MRTTFLLTGLLGGVMPVMAQPTAPPYTDAIVVTASLDQEQRDEVPASVDVISSREIAERQAVTVFELVGSVPGAIALQSGSPGHQASVFLRGADSDQTLVLWNGVPLDDPTFGGFDWAQLPTEGLERVEVVRGPFSALYGSDAVGGVVQVITARNVRGGRIAAEGGGNAYRRGTLAAGGGSGPIHVDAGGHSRRGDGEVANDFYDSDAGFARVEWAPQGGTSLGLLARLSDAEVGIPTSFGLETPHRHQSTRMQELALPISHTGGDWWLDGLLSRATSALTFRDPDDLFTPATDTSTEELRGRGVVTWRLGDRGWLAGGGEWERQTVDDRDASGIQLDGSRQRSWAAFGQGHWAVGRLSLELGARRDDNDVYGGKVSPKAGAVLAVGDHLRLRASYGEGFRAPAVGELFNPFFGNPRLEPETSRSVELGAGWSAGAWSLDLAGFDTRQRNLINFDLATSAFANIGRARSRGVEAAAVFRSGLWTARANATYLDTEDLATGLALLRRPRESANLVISVRPAAWTLSLVGAYVGRRADVATFGRADNPGYARFDVAARWQAHPHVAPYARVENLVDRHYEEVLGLPSPGRTWIGGLAVDF